jgi:hypothetical protein
VTRWPDNFVLGDVGFDIDNSFVTLDFELIADIDDTNATPDTWSLGIAVTGLTDVGTLAASVAPLGAKPGEHAGGHLAPAHGRDRRLQQGRDRAVGAHLLRQGSFRPGPQRGQLRQRRQLRLGPEEHRRRGRHRLLGHRRVLAGPAGGQVAGRHDLEDPGVGHNDIDADTWGVYGTWISPNGFYLDASTAGWTSTWT